MNNRVPCNPTVDVGREITLGKDVEREIARACSLEMASEDEKRRSRRKMVTLARNMADYPNPNFKAFMQQIMKDITGGMGIPEHMLRREKTYKRVPF